jgi:L-amino acid N-acyltransferase YncA
MPPRLAADHARFAEYHARHFIGAWMIMTDIRLATVADIPAILDIANWYAANTPANFAVIPETLAMWEQAWREQRERYAWLVVHAAAEGATEPGIVGFAKASPFRLRCAYRWTVETTVYLRSGWQGRGLGRELYERVLSISRRQGYRKAIGGITLPNAASVSLHERFGFRHVGTMPRVGWKFGKWHDVGFWELEFDGGDWQEPIENTLLVAEVLAKWPLSAS